MATQRQAARARVANAIASQTDLVLVTNMDCADCRFQINPPGALSPPSKFSDFELDDFQMAAVVGRILACSPEPEVKAGIGAFPPLRAAMQVSDVIDMLEALILGVENWDGTCMDPACCG